MTLRELRKARELTTSCPDGADAPSEELADVRDSPSPTKPSPDSILTMRRVRRLPAGPTNPAARGVGT